MVRSVGPAGLERTELKRLTERVEWLFQCFRKLSPRKLGSGRDLGACRDVCETTKAIDVRIEGRASAQVRLKLACLATNFASAARRRKRSCGSELFRIIVLNAVTPVDRVIPLRWSIDISAATAELSTTECSWFISRN